MPVKPPEDDDNQTEVKEQSAEDSCSTTCSSAENVTKQPYKTSVNNADVPSKLHLKTEMVTSKSGEHPLNATVKPENFVMGENLTPDNVILEKQAAKEQDLKAKLSKLHQDTNHSLDGGSQTDTSSTSTPVSSRSSSFEKLSLCSLSSCPQPASDVHLSPKASSTSLHTISSMEYPPEFKESQYDCVLIHNTAEEDKKMAKNFKELIEKFLVLEDQRPPSVCMLDDSFHHIQSDFDKVGEAVERSTTMFLFMTRNFVSDSWTLLQKDECLMKSLTDPTRRWCVVPLHTKPKTETDFTYPFGLRSLKGMDVWKMVKGSSLSEVNPQRIEMADLDEHFMRNMKTLLNQRLCHKLKREREQEANLKQWIKVETRQRLEAYRRQQELPQSTGKKMNECSKIPQKEELTAQGILNGRQTNAVNVIISHCGNLQIGSNNQQHVTTAEVNENDSSLGTEYEVIEMESGQSLGSHSTSDERTWSNYQSDCTSEEEKQF